MKMILNSKRSIAQKAALIGLISYVAIACSSSVKLSNINKEKNITVEHWVYNSMPEKLFKLPDMVEETSGLIADGYSFWTHNDSGGEPMLYKIEGKSGNIIAKVLIENAENRDWEDITQDDQYIYVGDHGNNAGMRKDQKVYKIDKSDIQGRDIDTVYAEIISFQFSEQQSWEFQLHSHNYDCESLIDVGDQLALLSKNWDDEKTRIYFLSKNPGNYTLNTAMEIPIDGLVTGADYNLKNGMLVLIGYKDKKPFIAMINDFMTIDSPLVKRIALPKIKFAQTEGIVMVDNHTIIFSAENTKRFKQAMYSLDANELISGMERDEND